MEVNNNKEVITQFRPVDVVRWDAITIDISSMQTEQHLLSAIDESLGHGQTEADGRSLIIRVTLEGRGDLHQTLIKPRFIAELLEAINTTWVQQSPFVWCERMIDATSQPFNREQRLQGVDFLSDFLRLCDEARVNSEVIAEMRQLLGDIYAQGRPSQYLKDNPPSDNELLEMLTRAEQLCLAELLEEEGE